MSIQVYVRINTRRDSRCCERNTINSKVMRWNGYFPKTPQTVYYSYTTLKCQRLQFLKNWHVFFLTIWFYLMLNFPKTRYSYKHSFFFFISLFFFSPLSLEVVVMRNLRNWERVNFPLFGGKLDTGDSFLISSYRKPHQMNNQVFFFFHNQNAFIY